MKREEFLNTEETKTRTINDLIEVDGKFLRRAIQALDNEIDDAETALKKRLMLEEAIDASVIEVLHAKVGQLKARKALYEDFQNTYYAKAN